MSSFLYFDQYSWNQIAQSIPLFCSQAETRHFNLLGVPKAISTDN